MTDDNLTEQCDWLSGGNRTEPRVTELPDAASCLFLSVLPDGEAVPALVCVFVLLTLFSFLVNAFTLFGLERSEDLSWEPRVALFYNLILSDLLQTATQGPTVIHSLIQRRTIAFSTWCHVQYFVGTVSLFSSLLTITCMALERYFYVCHAIRYLSILTQSRLRLSLCLIWGYSISVTATNMLLLLQTGQQNEQVTRGLLCEPDMMEQYMGFPRAPAVFRKLTGSFTLLLCLLVYGLSYMRMYQDARKAMIPFNRINSKARKTVLFYCAMLFLQLLPLLLKVTSDALWEVEGTSAMIASSQEKPSSSTTAAVLHMSLLVMLLVPPCINPLVYGLRNVEMRQALFKPLRFCLERRGAAECRLEEMRVDIVLNNRSQ
ncbi:olfactory receptor 2AG2 [Centropristis striata]|uniref:olfactory receptor 2AG2 n=1 Tax=Centropristis striata TaxID=184440 RepID=UPI0027E03645|nr:olfactory receptor 2AG2 [Centropristis striata]